MIRKIKKQFGINLVEVMVSSLLVSMAYLWISKGQMTSVMSVSDSSNSIRMSLAAQEMINRIKLNPYPNLYLDEMSKITDGATYCAISVSSCLNKECDAADLVKYDVNQVYCANLGAVSNFTMALNCRILSTGIASTDCIKGVLIAGVTLEWDSKDPTVGPLSVDSADAVFKLK